MYISDHAVFYAFLILVATLFFYHKIWYRFVKQTSKQHNNFMNASSENINMLYSILLAFIVIVSWQNYNAAQNTLSDETAKIQILWRDSAAFPLVVRNAIKADLNKYIDNVVTHEWLQMQKKQNMIYNTTYRDLWQVYTHYQPRNQSEAIFLQASVNDLNELSQARKARILAANNRLPNGFWFLLIAGAACTIITTMLFEEIQLRLRYFIISLQILLLMTTFFLINSFEHPYYGLVALNKEAYLHAKEIINSQD